MPWKRGTQPKRQPGQVSPFVTHLQIQSLALIDAADPTKGYRIKALAASDKINSGRIRIRANAWRFRKQGAPLLFEHTRDPRVGSLVLGRWDKFETQAGIGMSAEGEVHYFTEPDPRAAVVADMVSRRLTDVSVGHSPQKLEISEDGDGAFLDVIETELGEISVVTVGMDGDATYELQVASAYGYEWSDDSGRPPQEGDKMDRKLLIQMLNMAGQSLKEDANDAEIVAAVNRMAQNASLGSRAAEVLAAIGLDTGADIGTVKQTIASIKSPANFVPKADYDTLVKQSRETRIAAIIAESTNIPKGSVEFAKALLTQGLEQGIGKDASGKPEPGRVMFETWYATLPAIRTQQLTPGAASGVPPAQQNQDGGDEMEPVTDEDREWCQLLGYFRDERDPETGKVKMKAVDRMAQMAEISSSDALTLLFGQPVPMTAMDKVLRAQQMKQRMAQRAVQQ